MGKGVSTLREVEPRLLRIKEAAAYYGATVWFIRSLVWSRAVPHVVFGKRILLDRADLDRYLESQKKAAA